MIQSDGIIPIIDCSGSMAGQAISIVNTQLRELLSQLKSLIGFREGDIWFHSMLAKEKVYVSSHGVNSVQKIISLRDVVIQPGKDGLYPRCDYARVFRAVNEVISGLDSERNRGKTKTLTFILFTDGNMILNDSAAKAFAVLNSNPRFSDPNYCKRYVVCADADSRSSRMPDDRLLRAFAGSSDHYVSSRDFSRVLSDISSSLLGDTPNLVF